MHEIITFIYDMVHTAAHQEEYTIIPCRVDAEYIVGIKIDDTMSEEDIRIVQNILRTVPDFEMVLHDLAPWMRNFRKFRQDSILQRQLAAKA
jgi:hypothetical protein